ncbi:MAG: CPBP family intramembrane glutamic endopeptidase [Candidatus Nanopelagicales bacterium]|nr:CPBP family intramembrane glutamic endopeptidase [Candidatus Nanopelagicales bacterium]
MPTSWGVRDAVIALVGAFLLALAGAIVALEMGVLGSGADLVLGTLVPWIVMAGWPLWIVHRRGNGPRIDLGLRLSWSDLGWGLLGGVAALVLGSLAAALTTLWVGDFDSAAGDVAREIAESGAAWLLVLFAVLVVVGAPFVEELVFRGLLWAGLRRRGWSAWVTGVVTTLAFALFHLEIKRILVLAAVAAVLAVLRQRTAALGAPMVAHAVNNLPGAIAMVALASG